VIEWVANNKNIRKITNAHGKHENDKWLVSQSELLEWDERMSQEWGQNRGFVSHFGSY
jgi:hypothetical protein